MRVFVGVLLVAFNLRIGISTIGPVVDRIRDDTGMSSALAGILTAVPFIFMAGFVLVGTALVRRIGFSRLLWIALILVTFGTVVRALPGSSAALLLGTVPIGIGVAFAGGLLPGVVKQHFSHRAGAVTGAYVASFSVGASIAALAVVPLSDSIGGWRWALALTALPAMAALCLWPVAGVRRSDMEVEAGPPRRKGPSRTAVVLGLMFGGQSMCFAALIAWVAAIYMDGGWSVEEAALATASIPLLTIPASLVAPALSDGHDRRLWIVGAALLITMGLVGMAFALEAAGWVWLVLVGVGIGALFPLILSLPVDLGDGALAVTDLSAWMQAIGYVMAAAAPVIVGALRDATGGFQAGLVMLTVIMAATGLLGLVGLPGRVSSRPARVAAR